MNITHWTVTLPGRPVSVNHTYEIVRRRAVDRHGQPVLNQEGAQKTYTSLGKKSSVKKYQRDIQLILQAAQPMGFRPPGMIYVVYDFYLDRDIDVDNTYKAIHDVLAVVLGVNDRVFLPIARCKEIKVAKPFIRLTILDAMAWKIDLVQVLG